MSKNTVYGYLTFSDDGDNLHLTPDSNQQLIRREIHQLTWVCVMRDTNKMCSVGGTGMELRNRISNRSGVCIRNLVQAYF